MSHGLRVDLFGDLRCTLDGVPISLPPGKPTLLLALLALEAGRTVSTTEIIDALWPDAPPRSARQLVHTYVSAVRRAAHPSSSLETVPAGYRLTCPREHVDVHRFLSDSPHFPPEEWPAALAASAPPILAGRSVPFVAEFQRRVDDLREEITLRSWEHRVRHGGDPALLVELHEAVRSDPLREDKAHLLARALGASGRYDEGIAALDSLRLRLARELGVDPSPNHDQLRSQLLARASAEPQSRSHAGVVPDAQEPVPPVPLPRRALTRRVVGSALLAVPAAILGLWWATRDENVAPDQVSRPALVQVTDDGAIVGVTDLPVEPTEIAIQDGTAWVLSPSSSSVLSVDLDDGDIEAFGLDHAPVSMAARAGSVVVALAYTGTVVSVTDGTVSPPSHPVEGASGKLLVQSGENGLWVATVTGEVHPPPGTSGWDGPVRIESQPTTLRTEGNTAWLLTKDSLISSSGPAQTVSSTLRGLPEDLALGAGQAWAITSGDNRIWRADSRSRRVVQTGILSGRPVSVVADGENKVWVALQDPASVVRLDTQTLGATMVVPIPGTPVDLAVRGEDLFVAVRPLPPTANNKGSS